MSSAEALYREARVAQGKELNAEALRLFQEAAKDKHIGAHCFAVALADETKSATAALDALLLKHPHDSACLLLRARESIFAGKLAEAQKFAVNATKYGSKDPLTWATLGFAEFRRQEYLIAAQAFEKSVALDSSVSANVFNVGYAYYLGGEYEPAHRWLTRAIKAQALNSDLLARAKKSLAVIDGALWICPMHSEETGSSGETCGICKMDLEPISRGLKSE